jgi:hypothetical protein
MRRCLRTKTSREMKRGTAMKETIICRETRMITTLTLPKRVDAPLNNNSLIKKVMLTSTMPKRKKKLRSSKETTRKITSKRKRMMVSV